MSNKILARTSTCTRTSALTEPIVAIRYESKDPWRKQRKRRECKRRAGRFNVVISISCLQTRRVCCQIAHHAAQIQSRLYDHNVFVPLEKLRAHPASNGRGPLNESWHEMWPRVSNLHTATTLHSNHLRQKRLVVLGLHPPAVRHTALSLFN
jgi:hypothetical protein